MKVHIALEELLIPSLLALYTTLNDDDEDIRNVAAYTASSILKTSLAAPAASKIFVPWLTKRYKSNPTFIQSILHQMTGGALAACYQHPDQVSYIRFQKQFDIALKEDDALFAQEEENLYIDEVRDIGLWGELVQAIPATAFATQNHISGGPKYGLIREFALWVVDAVNVLNATMTKDGPLGWTSKPHAYKIVFRVLRCANVLLDWYSMNRNSDILSTMILKQEGVHLEVEKIISGLQRFGREAANKDIHLQLIRELNRQKLLGQPVSNKISLKWKTASRLSRFDIPEDHQRLLGQQSRESIATPNNVVDVEEHIAQEHIPQELL